MLKSLRLRLSLLYLMAALGLVALLGAGTYGLLALYFQRSTDLALQYKMATEFRLRGLSLPPELAAAEQAWLQDNSGYAQPASSAVPSSTHRSDDDEEEEEGDGAYLNTPVYSGEVDGESDERYDGSLAPVFVLPETGAASVPGLPVVNDPAAVNAAVQHGWDLRTVSLSEDTRVRLLTYHLGGGAILQVGRLLTDQDRLLSQYLTGLTILGSIASLLLALMSWGLAGRSIRPVQQAWDQQQQFISNASHELRAPLTLLRASADYALRNPDPAERETALQDILGEVDYMNRLVEDLLLLSRLDARRLGLASEKVLLPTLLGETARQMESVARERGVVIQLDTCAGSVRGDPIRLRQVLLILLDNAMRHTPAGGMIRIGSRRSEKYVTVYVSDSGPGIPPEHLAHVFERFYQVPGQAAIGRGNGLGLSIAKALVEAQGGTITLKSHPGKGTTALLQFPPA